jgi:hypothetical protein
MALWIDHKKAAEVARIVANIMQKEYTWDDNTKQNEISNYLKYVEKTVAFMK